MTQDVTGFGLKLRISASNSFPAGFDVTAFADDADSLDFSPVAIGDSAMGLNGDLITWNKAAPLPMTINVIPGTADDLNLQALASANRVAQGKRAALDRITATIVYPDARVITLTGGQITAAPFGNSVSSQGRVKTNSYSFMFEQKIGA